MKKAITSLIRWLANSLYNIAFWLENKDSSACMQSKFVDLAPSDDADEAGVYSEAILFATNNSKVSNIALTGPYGSGKSSIIQSFLKKYRRPALHISFAAFDSEADSEGEKVSYQDIERSILQQMLYGADSNKIPLSRFKRIQSPNAWSIFKSLYIMLGILAFWYVFHQREEVVNGSFFAPLMLSNWLNLGALVLAATFLWVTLHHLYVASFALSIKSISLKDVEIKSAHDDQTSILNRHLDEIIYFFESTDYDLVVIEDIDRFENTEIFITLREINSLVNGNAGVKRTIRFLYALRDDMFDSTDRTKFFEFIIPVIPIINTSNSIDMMLEQGRRLELDERLDRQFLREVSRYLNDLRLIRNIFNEYAIYVANLKTDGECLLDANKLLAILIYKNVYPRDFEQLHQGSGTLAEILSRQGELIRESESTYRSQITELEDRLKVAERQTPSDLRELRQIYAMALIEKLPENTARVSLDGRTFFTLQQLGAHDECERFLYAPCLFYQNFQGRQQQHNIPDLQSEVDSLKSYQQRKEEIESKATDSKNKSVRRIRDLRSKIAALHTTKLNELLRLNTDLIQAPLKDLGENGELARFLILEGHLDDTYYQYTSLFHSGRLSPNDNKFLIQIRAFVTPEPNFPIDNPKEVIAAMRDEDFRQSYVLNVKLVDSLLDDRGHCLNQAQKLFECLAADFESCEDFFDAYYESGRHVAGLLSGLAAAWTDLVPAVIASPKNIFHVSQLLAGLTEDSLKMLARDFDELPEFVSANLPEILAQSPALAPERLKCLGFEVKDLASIKEHSGVVRFMFEEGLFELTIANLEYAYVSILGEKDLEPLREMNLTTLSSANNAILMERVERDFDRYLSDVLLELKENSKEGAAAILAVVRRDTLDEDDVREFLEQQTTLLPTLEDVPQRLHAVLFKLSMIEPTWVNCRNFMEGEGFEADSLVGYLDQDVIRSAILQQPIPGDSDSVQLRQFLIGASSLSDTAYRAYVHALPKPFIGPPEGLEPAKLRILIDEGKITFSEDSLDALADFRNLQVLFVAANLDAYLTEPDNFALDDVFREELLRSEIKNEDKLQLVELMDLDALADLPERSGLIGSVIASTDAEIPNLNGSVAQSLIKHSAPIATQISLFNKCHSLMDDNEVRQVLANLPEPFSRIQAGYNKPRLGNTPENQALVRWLDSRNIISSWSHRGAFSDDIKVNLYRR